MRHASHRTAAYRILQDGGGMRFRFFCEVSGAAICTTAPTQPQPIETALDIAWHSEGREHFSLCHRCGRWVSDLMYNPNTLQCVDCSHGRSSRLSVRIAAQGFGMSEPSALRAAKGCNTEGRNPMEVHKLPAGFRFGTEALKRLKVCPRCGSLTSVRLRACPDCGGRLPLINLFQRYQQNHRLCPECDTALSDGMKFCPHCGTKITIHEFSENKGGTEK